MTEHDRFSAMLRDVVAPAVRSVGMRGSGRRFVLPDNAMWRIVAFQLSKWNDAHTVRFTVNLFTAGKAEWERLRAAQDWVSAAPSGNSNELVGKWMRLGHLMPVAEDHWWALTAETDPVARGVEVADAIVRYGLPWLRGEVELDEF